MIERNKHKAPRTPHEYSKVEIGTKYLSLTLVQKGRPVEGKRGAPGWHYCEWLLRCDCTNEVWLKRHEVVNGKRSTCGNECRIEGHTISREKSKVREAGMAPVHFDVAGFEIVEKRKLPDDKRKLSDCMAVWTIFREIGGMPRLEGGKNG